MPPVPGPLPPTQPTASFSARAEVPAAQAVCEDVAPVRNRAASTADRCTLLTRGFQRSGRDEVAELQAALAELRSLPPLPPSAQREQQAALPPQTCTGPNKQRLGEVYAEAN